MRVRLVIRRSRVRFPPSPATFVCDDWSWTIFYDHFLPSAVVSFGRKNILKYWLTDKRTSQPREKCGKLKWPPRHDLSSVDCAVKFQTKPKERLFWFLNDKTILIWVKKISKPQYPYTSKIVAVPATNNVPFLCSDRIRFIVIDCQANEPKKVRN